MCPSEARCLFHTDLVMPLQREKTALKRGALDNLYLHNDPRVEVAESNAGPNTPDDLLVSRPGGVVRTKTAGGLNWQVVPDITTSIYPMLQYLDATVRLRNAWINVDPRSWKTRDDMIINVDLGSGGKAQQVAQVMALANIQKQLVAGARSIWSVTASSTIPPPS